MAVKNNSGLNIKPRAVRTTNQTKNSRLAARPRAPTSGLPNPNPTIPTINLKLNQMLREFETAPPRAQLLELLRVRLDPTL